MKKTNKVFVAIEMFIKAAGILSGLITIGLTLMICIDIVMRVFGTSIIGSVEIISMCVPIIVFMGAGYTALNEMHIRVDVIKRWPHMDRVMNLLCIAAIVISGWYGIEHALQTRSIGITTNILRMQRWPTMLITAIGMLIVAVAMILNEIKAYMRIYQKLKGKNVESAPAASVE